MDSPAKIMKKASEAVSLLCDNLAQLGQDAVSIAREIEAIETNFLAIIEQDALIEAAVRSLGRSYLDQHGMSVLLAVGQHELRGEARLHNLDLHSLPARCAIAPNVVIADIKKLRNESIIHHEITVGLPGPERVEAIASRRVGLLATESAEEAILTELNGAGFKAQGRQGFVGPKARALAEAELAEQERARKAAVAAKDAEYYRTAGQRTPAADRSTTPNLPNPTINNPPAKWTN